MKTALLLAFIILSLLYFPLNKRVSKFYWEHHLDRLLPVVPIFVIPYVLFYFYKVFSIVWLWNTPYALPFLTSMVIAYVTAVLFWYFFPNGVKRTALAGYSLWEKAINFLYAHDSDGNGFPSAHVFITINSAFFIGKMYPTAAISSWILAFAICVSTVLIKQHYLLDIVGGLLWSVFSISLALML